MSIKFSGSVQHFFWKGSPRDISYDLDEIRKKLERTERPCYAIRDFRGRIGFSNAGELVAEGQGLEVLAVAGPLPASQLGDPNFRNDYNLKYNYMTGAMANGIASEELVISVGEKGLLGSFGAAGLLSDRVLRAIDTIQNTLINNSYAFNLIHSPNEDALEENSVKLFLEKGVHIVEASAYLALTEHIVHYRLAGLSLDENGNIKIKNKVIAKISRKEVARHFMSPAPEHFVKTLLEKGKITPLQAELAAKVSMADDITCEADSGGHTDNRPLIVLLPTILQLRNELQARYRFTKQIRVGAAGGISTPASAAAAYMMGAAYIVTGSLNQACVEAGTSEYVRKLLQSVSSSDVTMAPSSDMFEMGVELQVLKRSTLFGPRASKLYEYYKQYKSIDDIPADKRKELETKVFKQPLEEVWLACIDFFNERDPIQIQRAEDNPHRKMALIFRWYLGLSSHWANSGTPDRAADYQIWCGPAMGAFNDWAKGSYLEAYEHRRAADVAERIMQGAAYLYRIQYLKMQGVSLPVGLENAIAPTEAVI